MLKPFACFTLSLLLVAFGQPAWSWEAGLIASLFGYALFWVGLNEIESGKRRFWVATAWFTLVQIVQLSWFVSHPYLYIWIVYFLVTFLMGLQFGWLSVYVRPQNLQKMWKILAIAGFWVLT